MVPLIITLLQCEFIVTTRVIFSSVNFFCIIIIMLKTYYQIGKKGVVSSLQFSYQMNSLTFLNP